jgi:hypothetical protein
MTDESRLVFVAKGLGAFFGFLLLFFGVSTYLGGGITGIGVSIALAVAVALGLIILWPRLREQKPIVDKKASAPAPTPTPTGGPTELCPPGPYAVVYGDTVKLSLRVKTGDKIEGYVREINNDFFDWCIVDEDNMIRFFDGRRFRTITGEKNTTISKVNCRIPHSGPYYLLLDIGSRQNDRQVEVELRLVPT